MKKTLGMVFFLTVLAGMAGCGQKNTANTMEQTDTQTEKTLEEHLIAKENKDCILVLLCAMAIKETQKAKINLL